MNEYKKEKMERSVGSQELATLPKVLLFGNIVCGNFISAAILSLQAPFMPLEARTKGIKPSEYGIIFSIYSLSRMLVSPIIGYHLTKIGVQKCFCGGIFLVSFSAISFGFLHYIDSPALFLTLALF